MNQTNLPAAPPQQTFTRGSCGKWTRQGTENAAHGYTSSLGQAYNNRTGREKLRGSFDVPSKCRKCDSIALQAVHTRELARETQMTQALYTAPLKTQRLPDTQEGRPAVYWASPEMQCKPWAANRAYRWLGRRVYTPAVLSGLGPVALRGTVACHFAH